MPLRSAALALAAALLAAAPAGAMTSTPTVPSKLYGEGLGGTTDGRLFINRVPEGWVALVLRPEALSLRSDGLPRADGALFSDPELILTHPSDPALLAENAVAVCATDESKVGFRCDEDGKPSAAGPLECYDLWLIDSDAAGSTSDPGVMRRRRILIGIRNPRTPRAAVDGWRWIGSTEPLSTRLHGIEPTVTEDGRLLVWQGNPDGKDIDVLMYSFNSEPCGRDGWSPPRVISEMHTDPLVAGRYRLADKPLRAGDGAEFAPGDLVHGAYPWISPKGDVLVFEAAYLPCRHGFLPEGCTPEVDCVQEPEPIGCDARRNSMSAVGYPTNWAIATIDGGANPDTDGTARSFLTAIPPKALPGLPVTPGLDVWPLLTSDTGTYAELVFDDGLDGRYAGLWHFNELIDRNGDAALDRVADTSGYFNTGTLLGGLRVSSANDPDGVVGRSLVLDGVDDRVEVPNSVSLSPLGALTIDLWVRPTADPDCSDAPNPRLLVGKGDPGDLSYALVLRDDRGLELRLGIDGTEHTLSTRPIPLDRWTHVSCEYEGATGAAACFLDGEEAASTGLPAGVIQASAGPLRIGAPGPSAACPTGLGAFAGRLDEVSISRVARRIGARSPSGACEAAPRNGCKSASHSAIALDARGGLAWRWRRGEETAASQLGDPTAGTGYALCLYDTLRSRPRLVASRELPAGSGWRPIARRGFSYRDGRTSLRLLSGAEGKARAVLRASNLELDRPSLATDEGALLHGDPAVTAQLVSDDGTCWTSAFRSPLRNDAEQYRAKEVRERSRPAPGSGLPTNATVRVSDLVDASGEGSVELALAAGDGSGVAIDLGGETRVIEAFVSAPETVVSSLEGESGRGTFWFRPRPLGGGLASLRIEGRGRARVTLWARGAPVPPAEIERSLVWRDPALLDAPSTIGLGRLMATVAEDGHGGLLLERWFESFASGAAGGRLAPAMLLDRVRAEQGTDPTRWDLDLLPFRVTAIHNRLDLAGSSGGCGQLRISLASTDDRAAPLHLIFLFRQEPGPDDVTPDGRVHCLGTARRWARLSALDAASFRAAARAWLDRALTFESFLLAESIEQTVSPWEWRQWQPIANGDPATAASLPTIFVNPPLFQTPDTASLNRPGRLRDRFLAFVERNAAALDAERLALPPAFRAPSARLAAGVERTPLDLSDLPAGLRRRFPRLAERIELGGCPACHTHDAPFVQTSAERRFSPFYQRELEARKLRLDLLNQGADLGDPRLGPLQEIR